MSSKATTSDFLAELVRAVTEIHLLEPIERRQMIERGIVGIRELRQTLEDSGADAPMTSRTLVQVERLIADIEDTPHELVAAAFVVLADEIKKLAKLCETRSTTKDWPK